MSENAVLLAQQAVTLVFFKSNERSKDSFISIGNFFVFFSGESFGILRPILILRGLTFGFFLNSVCFIC